MPYKFPPLYFAQKRAKSIPSITNEENTCMSILPANNITPLISRKKRNWGTSSKLNSLSTPDHL